MKNLIWITVQKTLDLSVFCLLKQKFPKALNIKEEKVTIINWFVTFNISIEYPEIKLDTVVAIQVTETTTSCREHKETDRQIDDIREGIHAVVLKDHVLQAAIREHNGIEQIRDNARQTNDRYAVRVDGIIDLIYHLVLCKTAAATAHDAEFFQLILMFRIFWQEIFLSFSLVISWIWFLLWHFHIHCLSEDKCFVYSLINS